MLDGTSKYQQLPFEREAADRNGEISVGTVVGFLYPFCS
nr:MAG TPA: hypothetical protein [Caudoviricetes sp.]DAM78624.1 MAG TPA: hypothetical protein [Caudoviricetes sp.]